MHFQCCWTFLFYIPLYRYRPCGSWRSRAVGSKSLLRQMHNRPEPKCQKASETVDPSSQDSQVQIGNRRRRYWCNTRTDFLRENKKVNFFQTCQCMYELVWRPLCIAISTKRFVDFFFTHKFTALVVISGQHNKCTESFSPKNKNYI